MFYASFIVLHSTTAFRAKFTRLTIHKNRTDYVRRIKWYKSDTTGYVVDTDNLDKCKPRIDKFWQHQEVLFNYKSKLPGTENRLQIYGRGGVMRLSPFFRLCHVSNRAHHTV